MYCTCPKLNILGAKCLEPEAQAPDDEFGLKLIWNPDYPPRINQTIRYT